MTARLIIGDVREVLASLPDASVDLIACSPPFLALRSYLPGDHPGKGREIGAESTPAAYLDVLLGLTAEWARVLASHGSLAVELGDCYSGSGGAGGDYNDGGLRDGQQRFDGTASRSGWHRQGARADTSMNYRKDGTIAASGSPGGGPGWPLDKSASMVPSLYAVALAYGLNPLTGQPSPAGRWRVRNFSPWIRSAPPVGALGDKVRPATSFVTVACRARDRWFDLDAGRHSQSDHTLRYPREGEQYTGTGYQVPTRGDGGRITAPVNTSGAPPLDWQHLTDAVLDAELGRWNGKIPTHARTARGIGSRASTGKAAADERGGNWDSLATEEHGEGDATSVRGRHLRRALERAGILGAAPDVLEVNPKGYGGAHFAVWPEPLVRPLIEMMCPRRVCRTCGEPSRRITQSAPVGGRVVAVKGGSREERAGRITTQQSSGMHYDATKSTTTGWASCGCPDTDGVRPDGYHTGTGWRPGVVLDPFSGSGTTLLVADSLSRDAIGIDIDERSVELTRERFGPLLATMIEVVG